ncbi:MAG: hypothetical protein HQL30_10825 [Candidatus Omnitrophica bacterium]|nr:hypothetical protein [Candidatus Omnitrophota bacterium]
MKIFRFILFIIFLAENPYSFGKDDSLTTTINDPLLQQPVFSQGQADTKNDLIATKNGVSQIQGVPGLSGNNGAMTVQDPMSENTLTYYPDTDTYVFSHDFDQALIARLGDIGTLSVGKSSGESDYYNGTYNPNYEPMIIAITGEIPIMHRPETGSTWKDPDRTPGPPTLWKKTVYTQEQMPGKRKHAAFADDEDLPADPLAPDIFTDQEREDRLSDAEYPELGPNYQENPLGDIADGGPGQEGLGLNLTGGLKVTQLEEYYIFKSLEKMRDINEGRDTDIQGMMDALEHFIKIAHGKNNFMKGVDLVMLASKFEWLRNEQLALVKGYLAITKGYYLKISGILKLKDEKDPLELMNKVDERILELKAKKYDELSDDEKKALETDKQIEAVRAKYIKEVKSLIRFFIGSVKGDLKKALPVSISKEKDRTRYLFFLDDRVR